jgi:hypothetical protein
MDEKYALGIMGSRAPFHSQKQKIPTTTKLETSGASTTADVQGKVTPPCQLYERSRLLNVYTTYPYERQDK